MAAYAATTDTLRDYLSRIRAIVTLDSPLQGVAAGVNIWQQAQGCRVAAAFDAFSDMKVGKPLIQRIQDSHPSVPLFTVDANLGLDHGYPVALDPDSQVWWQTSHLQVSAPGHGDVWEGSVNSNGSLDPVEQEVLQRFVYCAVAGLQPAKYCDAYAKAARDKPHIPSQSTTHLEAPVAGSSAKLRTEVGQNSTVTTTLTSPSGRVIDSTTTAQDVTHYSDPTADVFEILQPEQGIWSIDLFGADIPPEGEDVPVSVMVSPDEASDPDGDGVADDIDNCPGLWNPDQSNVNQDGLGDACDPDIDNDGVPNESDNCPSTANLDQIDSDHNGLGDACDPGGVTDSDSDGVVDNLDNCPFDANPNQANADGDAWGDVCDPVANPPVAPVGGIAELPDLPSHQTTAPTGGSHSFPRNYAAPGGGLAAAAFAISLAAWYARKRWHKA